MQRSKDLLQRFLIETAGVRGELVQLDESWQEVLRRADYPANVRELLGKAMATTALLSATIKFQGRLTLQVKGDGPVGLLVSQTNDKGGSRAMAEWQAEPPTSPLSAIFGVAQMVVAIDNEATGEQYQGIVSTEGESLETAIEQYFLSSEQLETRLWLFSDAETSTGLLLQKLPESERQDDDGWERTCQLASTIKAEEMATLPAEEILHRLFHEEDVRLFDATSMAFECVCSRQRTASMILGMGQEDAESLLAEQGQIDVSCQFCGANYAFDKVDVAQIFTPGQASEQSNTVH